MGAEPVSLWAFLQGDIDAAQFRHADHVHMGFEILQRHDFSDAVAVFARALKAVATRAGASRKYHETITLAFLALIAERRALASHSDFESFANANPDLMSKVVLERWYTRERLLSDVARQTFILPEPR